MANIKTLSEAADYLKSELYNEIVQGTSFQDAEVAELANIIVDVFNRFASEVNGYDPEE